MDAEKSFLNPFLGVPADSPLDPSSNNFSAKAWLQNLVGYIAKDPQRYPYRYAGVAFRHLGIHGFGRPTDYQKTVGNVFLEVGRIFRYWMGTGKQKVQILREFDGLIENGEMLLVLGRPGSGCSTLLKTISGDTDGFYVDTCTQINYQGIPASQMHTQFRGEAIYMAENDVHFPQLTVGQTLLFAAKARAPRDYTFPGVTRDMFAEHMRDVIMATFGIRHTIDTNVGNDLVKGVSGGERKRVSIAEALLSGSPLQCWDNSTRGLDSANALAFCRTLKHSADLAGTTILVSLYQGSQEAYKLFDKVTLLYEGQQIYFGPGYEAQSYFTALGFEKAARQTIPDFLTSLTSPGERRIRPGFERKTPKTADDFVKVWKESQEYARLLHEINEYNNRYPIGGNSVEDFATSRRLQQAKHQHVQSPFTLSIYQQVMLCVGRGFQRLKGDASVTISGVIANSILALVVGDIFYNLEDSTATFDRKAVLLFFGILLNAFASALEIIILYDQRPIVEKHARYALYHPFAEAISSALCDMPYKVSNCISFNIVLYFMTNLRRTPGAFFTFLAFSFFTTLSLSMVFRTVGASSRTLAQALCPTAVFILSLMVYTGYIIPIHNMVPWFRWINYIDPIAYAFESLMINEFDGRFFECAAFVPMGPEYANNIGDFNRICAVVGAVPGSNVVSGSDFLLLSFNYQRSHLWRNLIIIAAIFVFFTCTYLLATEYIIAQKSKGEVLLFRRGCRPVQASQDSESSSSLHTPEESYVREVPRRISAVIQKQTSVFHWRGICYDVKAKHEQRRLLDHVDGWVKPGTLTALMGPSGAGKTTLLDVLATRDTIGVASGDAFVDGNVRDISFQRKTGYAQQQDSHLETMTVREALQFNALMCQPRKLNKAEKLAYVEEVINLLDMNYYADSIIGLPGEGLNIEQRKKLTIAVELAAKPKLLLFLDEPSSGLDSQTSWAILDLLRKLNMHGQAILCTIHQPSAMLFQRFDRLLLLAPEGKPVYFGDIGPSSSTIINYFERNGSKPCPTNGNPAEWIMEVLGCAPENHSTIDWHEVWKKSPEFAKVHEELDSLERGIRPISTESWLGDPNDYQEFAAPFSLQLWECFKRVNSQYWRSPSYIYSKAALCILAPLFLGFSFFKADNSLQGLQSQTFAFFMLLTQSSNLVPQILPNFCVQRSLYEARERPAKTYSWKVFILSNILVELPWNSLMSVFIFVCWYFPIGFYRNAELSHEVVMRSGTVFVLIWVYMMYTSTFAHLIQAGVELAGMAGNYANLLFMLTLIFCGVLASPTALPGFWIFMYRVSPFTYLVSAVLSVSFANAPVRCSPIELLHFDPLPGTTCGAYMKSYINYAGGYLTNPNAMSACSFCPLDNTNSFLSKLGIHYADRWKNFWILWIFVFFNIFAAIFLYWLVRVPKKNKGLKISKTEVLPATEAHNNEPALKLPTPVDEGKFVDSIRSKASSRPRADCEM
ncbi:ABC transporter CDR4 [Tricladium varicosporioides]|nr:ABC transporter CDR4 [Hymenoscyphus varicosporioides]